MMKTTLGASTVALIALAGMEGKGVNALAMRQADSSLEGYLKPEVAELAQVAQTVRSTAWNTPLNVTFKNESGQSVQLFWHDYSGNLVSYGTIAAGGSMNMNTYATHPWSVQGTGNLAIDGDAIFVPEAGDNKRTLVIGQAWTELEGMCKDSMDRQYDDFRKPGAAYDSIAQCQADCAATEGCVAINLSETNNGGECILRMSDGYKVNLPEYYQFWQYAGVGPVDHAQRHGDYKCMLNPAYDFSANVLEGMCKDSNNNQYDDFRKQGAAYDSIGQCQMDCAITPGCVAANISETNNGGECILRISDGESVSLAGYYQFWNYAGKGAVASADKHGDYMCYVNP
jgi:hypothetical protein